MTSEDGVATLTQTLSSGPFVESWAVKMRFLMQCINYGVSAQSLPTFETMHTTAHALHFDSRDILFWRRYIMGSRKREWNREDQGMKGRCVDMAVTIHLFLCQREFAHEREIRAKPRHVEGNYLGNVV
jgi:hypothetical protein